MASGMFLKLDTRHHAVVNLCKFAWLGNHASLANRTGASVEVAKARCHYCSSCSCYPFYTTKWGAQPHRVNPKADVLDAVEKSEAAKL